MKFLIDNALSPLLADALRISGLDVVHVREIGLEAEEDEVVFARVMADGPYTRLGEHRFWYAACLVGPFEAFGDSISTRRRTQTRATSGAHADQSI